MICLWMAISVALVQSTNQNDVIKQAHDSAPRDRAQTVPAGFTMQSPGFVESRNQPYHAIFAVGSEIELYEIIGHLGDELFRLFGTNANRNRGPVTVRYLEELLYLFSITETMEEDPFHVAKAVVRVMLRWYEYRSSRRNEWTLDNQFKVRNCDILNVMLRLTHQID